MKKVKQMAGRSLRMTADMVKDAKKLLELMGCPVIQAPCEAEAQCSELVRQGFAYGVASDDMDCLAHGAQFMIRGFTNKNHPVVEIDYEAVLRTLKMTQEEFIDLCILCGCDYTPSIGGMGPKTAFNYLRKNGRIENVIRTLEAENPTRKRPWIIPENFNFQAARACFKHPTVIEDAEELKELCEFRTCDQKDLSNYLIQAKGFSENKVEAGVKRLLKAQTKPV